MIANAMFAALLLGQTPAPAATTPAPAPPLHATAIVGGDIWTVTKGIIKNGTVIIRGTKIEKVGGPDTKVPEGATIVDAKGHVVAPGFVTAQTTSGGGGGLVRGGGGRLRDALDPYTLPIPLALASGVTSAYVAGGAGLADQAESAQSAISTSNAIIKMTEADLTGMLLREPAMTTVSLGGGGGGGGGFGGFRAAAGGGGGGLTARYNLRDRFQVAKEYQDKLTAHEADKKAGKPSTEPRKPPGIDDYLTLVKKERILRVTASDVSDIRWALKLVDDYGVKMVITPATEGWIIADEIAARGVGLIITSRSRASAEERKNGPSGASTEAAAILKKAGVKFALVPPSAGFSTGGQLGRDLLTFPLEAAFAIRGGLDEQTALEALTIEPARILGIADRVGSIEEGKDADIIILNGDPLDYRTFTERAYVNGRLLYEKDKSTFFDYVKRRRAD